MRRPRTPAVGAAPAFALVTVLVLLASCTDDGPAAAPTPAASSPAPESSSTSSTSPASATADPLARFYDQRLRWSRCHRGFRCARLEVPLDYAQPTGRTIRLALVRLRRTGDGPRRSIVLNPGGPGGSGVDYALDTSAVSPDVRRRYDVVGFDPRGVQRSAPVRCLTDRQLDVFLSIDASPDTPEEEAETQEEWARLGEGCVAARPAVTAQVGTSNATRDLDVLRAALGDRRLTYLGKSYGTFLGASYAARYPRHVGRLVLDGQVDPTLGAPDLAAGQVTGFERALRSFLRDCVRRDDCPLEGDAAAAEAQLGRLVDATDRTPLQGADGRRVTQALAVYGIAAALYSQGSWPLLRQGIAEMRQGVGRTLLALADFYSDRGPNGRYTTNITEAFYAISCIDRPETRDLATQRADADRLAARSPVFGAFIGWGNLPCLGWPVPPDVHQAPVTAAGAAPILVVGTTRDPATPYEWAVDTERRLQDAALLTYVGDGHTAYGRGSSCVDRAVDRYLLTGALPPDGTRCR